MKRTISSVLTFGYFALLTACAAGGSSGGVYRHYDYYRDGGGIVMPSVLEVEATPLPSGPDMMPDMVMPMGMGSINSLIASLASFVRPSCPKADALQSGSPVKRLLDEGHV